TLPSWAQLVERQPCIKVVCSGCGEGFHDDEYTTHHTTVNDAREDIDSWLGLEDDDNDPLWKLVDDDLLCQECRQAREQKAAAPAGEIR
ncbi:MAG: hypothetical protein J0I40_06425, partial [Cellulomonas sp.]|nr:hypothetical protein [Cellulomonas sp.]